MLKWQGKESQTRIKDILMAQQWIIQKVHCEEKHRKENGKKEHETQKQPYNKIYAWTLLGWLSF